MTAEDVPSWEDRVVAEFGDGHAVEAIAARYGITVAQVYVVVEREVGRSPYPPESYQAAPPPYRPQGYQAAPPHLGPPAYQPPPGCSAPAHPAPGYPPPQAFPDEDVILGEYADGHDVQAIAWRHGIPAERVYEIVRRVVQDDS
ncbi:hypothetical protein [Actinoplanes siamensis]|uniref:Uncharacterized protein n=1 Tax=Actinoplanes siamensis TaxID=1223317 RepID=A0A919TMX6_9ACTN|nr:hypothetical protein [Actinoplanes siamensis]GIF08137.1 hypothetical protein Asi03nite_56750 [Actinoplanes siamensis]